jgi:hypothetical protein
MDKELQPLKKSIKDLFTDQDLLSLAIHHNLVASGLSKPLECIDRELAKTNDKMEQLGLTTCLILLRTQVTALIENSKKCSEWAETQRKENYPR